MSINHIYLVGPMGSGKSSIAATLSLALNAKLIDLDQDIERTTGKTICDIFWKEGERVFRDHETTVLKQAVKHDEHQSFIMATGGGIVLREENRRIIKSDGIVFYLRTSLDTQLNRLTKDPKFTQRALLKGAPPTKAQLQAIQAQRETLYTHLADHILDTDHCTVDTLATKIIQTIGK